MSALVAVLGLSEVPWQVWSVSLGTVITLCALGIDRGRGRTRKWALAVLMTVGFLGVVAPLIDEDVMAQCACKLPGQVTPRDVVSQ